MGIWSVKHPQSFSETLLHFFKAGVYCGFVTEITAPSHTHTHTHKKMETPRSNYEFHILVGGWGPGLLALARQAMVYRVTEHHKCYINYSI